jgi:hypothetical protein
VQAIGGVVAGRSDQSSEHAGAGQQHSGLDQTGGREVKQHARALGGRPRARVKPAGQLGAGGAFGEVAVAVGALDLAGVLAVGLLTPRVQGQAVRLGDGELARDRPGDDRRDVGRVREERAEKPHRRELNGEAEPVVIAATITDLVAVKVVEVKEPLELTRRRWLAVATVAGDLRRAEKVDRHQPSATLKPSSAAAALSAGDDRDHAPQSAQPRHRRSAARNAAANAGWCGGSWPSAARARRCPRRDA